MDLTKPIQETITWGLTNNEIFFVLFVLLLVAAGFFIRWVIKTSKEREDKYIEMYLRCEQRCSEQTEIISKIAAQLEVVKEIKSSVDRLERECI